MICCRKLTLADVDRVLCPDLLLNQTVYDLDSLVLRDCSPDPAMAEPPDAGSDGALGHSRSLSSGCLQSSSCDASTSQCSSLSSSLSSPVILEAPQATATKCSSTRHISHLHFESRFESGNLRKAIQVRFLCKSVLQLCRQFARFAHFVITLFSVSCASQISPAQYLMLVAM